jgi:hypothetical protein
MDFGKVILMEKQMLKAILMPKDFGKGWQKEKHSEKLMEILMEKRLIRLTDLH